MLLYQMKLEIDHYCQVQTLEMAETKISCQMGIHKH